MKRKIEVKFTLEMEPEVLERIEDKYESMNAYLMGILNAAIESERLTPSPNQATLQPAMERQRHPG